MASRIKSSASIPTSSEERIHTEHLIVATNRGPVEYYIGQDKKLKHRRGSGGVVTALLEALPSMDATWIALAMTEGDRIALQDAPDGRLSSPLPGQQMQLRYMTVSKNVYHNHYDMISNRVLWFAQHYLLDRPEASIPSERILHAWDNGYVKANSAIADAVCAEVERNQSSSTAVLLHDYHLYLAPAMIRDRCKPSVMQQFIHIPWPEIRYWQAHLPSSITQAIYNGLLGNDIIGFQTRRDVQNFLEGVRTLFDDADVDVENGSIVRQGRRSVVHDYPISISVWEERRAVQSTAGKRASRRTRSLLKEQNIMRVDRIEPTKNILQGFQAYQYLLNQHSELQGRITFLAFLVPSRQSLPIYRQYRQDILKLIENINQQFGDKNWTPIHAFVQNDRIEALVALQFYDALLVNPLIDGMNLVAKEGPAVNQKDGVLVLSRTSGAFQQLGNASIPISPADTVETAEALYKALTLSPEERHELAEPARQEVERDDLKTWISQQVRDINAVIE
jgi:trehalose 6-phosphate synthase